jgi:hypothetical protein
VCTISKAKKKLAKNPRAPGMMARSCGHEQVMGCSSEIQHDDASMLGKMVDLQDDNHPDDFPLIVSCISMEFESSKTATIVPCYCQIRNLVEGRSNLQVLLSVTNQHPAVVKKTTTPTWMLALPSRSAKSSPPCRSGPHVTAMRLSKQLIPPSSQSLLDRADEPPTKPTMSFKDA